MKNGSIVLMMALVVVLGALPDSASAQNAVGGPKKPVAVGGAAKQNSPVVPANKGGANTVSSPPKCAGATCAMKGHK
jgi:hypothetical protein